MVVLAKARDACSLACSRVNLVNTAFKFVKDFLLEKKNIMIRIDHQDGWDHFDNSQIMFHTKSSPNELGGLSLKDVIGKSEG